MGAGCSAAVKWYCMPGSISFYMICKVHMIIITAKKNDKSRWIEESTGRSGPCLFGSCTLVLLAWFYILLYTL